MTELSRIVVAFVAVAVSWLAAAAQPEDPPSMHAQGTFDVKVTPQKADNREAEAAGLARLALDKVFHGDLEGTSQGEMLASNDGKQPSGAYVALERVSGTLAGRHGSFVLVHRALMIDRVPREWTITVVPESGAGELVGLQGAMRITIADGRHHYDLDYTLPESAP